MSFLHPAILMLLPLAAVPVLLHLITLHRLKTTELSTFRFLFESYVRQQSRLKFLEVLLTILRTLVVLFLVLMVCRPVIKRWSALFRPGTGREKVLLVDCSASMNARTAGVSSLERAKAAALSVVQRLDRNDRLTLIRVMAAPEEVFSRFGSDTETIRAKIEGLETGPGRADFHGALRQVFAGSGKREALPVVYAVTDCQSGGWDPAQFGMDPVVPPGARVFVVDVGTHHALPNRAVLGDAPRQRAIVGLPVVLTPRVYNGAKSEAAQISVKLIVNDREVGRVSVTLKPGEVRTAELTYIPREAGRLRARFEIAPDRFPDDDTFLFTLNVSPPAPVVLVNGKPSADPFEDEALYLRTALTTVPTADVAPAAPGGAGPAGDGYQEFIRSLDVKEIGEPALNPELLRTASVVILANCGHLTAMQFGWLRDYVREGGGLMVFPGDLVKPETYSVAFFPVPGPQREWLSAVRLGPPEGDPSQSARFARLTAIDYRHPVLAVFDAPQTKYLTTVRFYRWFPLSPVTGNGNAWPLMSLSTGAPALVESRLGEGQVLVAAFPVNNRWSNLPLKPEFVPLMLRMINHVQRRAEIETPAAAPADGVSEIAVTKDWAPLTGTVTDAKGRHHPLAFRRVEARLVAPFDHPREKGYYTIAVKGVAGGKPRAGTAVVAVNVSPEESNFDTITQERLRRLMPQAKLNVVDASAEAQQFSGALGEEREIWRPLIWLLFVIMGVEFTIATLGGRKRARDVTRALTRRLGEVLPASWIGWATRTAGIPPAAKPAAATAGPAESVRGR